MNWKPHKAKANVPYHVTLTADSVPILWKLCEVMNRPPDEVVYHALATLESVLRPRRKAAAAEKLKPTGSIEHAPIRAVAEKLLGRKGGERHGKHV
jgi:hypothetical protein